MPRDSIELDRVSKLVYIVNETNTFYAVALRETGRVDLYWDMTLIDSPKESKVIFITSVDLFIL